MTSPTLALPVDLSPASLVVALRARSRALLERLTARLLALSVMLVIAVGTGLAIVTTTNPDWWQLHFSELGTFDDFSGHTFNATLVIAGLLIAAFAVRVRIDLVSLTPHRKVRPSRTLTVLMISVGIHLLGVGLVPLNTFEFLHDRLASGIMLSFLGLLILIVLRRRHVNPLLLWSSIAIAGGLVLAITAFVNGLINLAALEFVGFTLIFVWVGIFTASLERGIAHFRQLSTAHAQASARSERADAAPLDVSVPSAPAPAWGCTVTRTATPVRMPRRGAPRGHTHPAVSTTCDANALFRSPPLRSSITWPRPLELRTLVVPQTLAPPEPVTAPADGALTPAREPALA